MASIESSSNSASISTNANDFVIIMDSYGHIVSCHRYLSYIYSHSSTCHHRPISSPPYHFMPNQYHQSIPHHLCFLPICFMLYLDVDTIFCAFFSFIFDLYICLFFCSFHLHKTQNLIFFPNWESMISQIGDFSEVRCRNIPNLGSHYIMLVFCQFCWQSLVISLVQG